MAVKKLVVTAPKKDDSTDVDQVINTDSSPAQAIEKEMKFQVSTHPELGQAINNARPAVGHGYCKQPKKS